jgi:hypothetical protein
MSKREIPEFIFRRISSCVRCLCAVAALCLSTGALRAAPDETVSAICDDVARIVAAETGVPVDVLRAISLTETGRRKDGHFRPWPWTVNMEGTGKWFESHAAAQDYVDRHFARGARSFDVGCFQINYRWHGEAFSSVEEMFEPLANARYAARFLRELHAEFGDWSGAAGAYHSRTPSLARKYASRFDRIRARLPQPAPQSLDRDTVRLAAASPDDLPEAAERPNRYPLLIPGGSPSGPASLVPQARGLDRPRFLVLDAVRPVGSR